MLVGELDYLPQPEYPGELGDLPPVGPDSNPPA